MAAVKKKLPWKTILIGGLTALFSTIIISVWDTVQEVHENHIRSIIKEEMMARKNGFRSALADKLEVDKDEVVNVIVDWYNETQDYTVCGFKYIESENKVIYIHLDGEEYQAIFDDESTNWKFFNPQLDRMSWCQ